MIRFVIPDRLPGLNEYIAAERSSRYEAAKLKKSAEHIIILAAKTQLRGAKFQNPVIMRYTWVEPNKKRDKDNIAFARKFVQDALVKAGVLRNDGWGEIAGFMDDFAVDGKRARVEVEISEEKEEHMEIPCKPGDKVYQTDGLDIYESKVKRIVFETNNIAFSDDAIGESVFLTREEAEAALKKRE